MRVRRVGPGPVLVSLVWAVTLLLGGFAAIYLTWRSMSATIAVGAQLEYLVVGGAGGLALIGAGTGIMYVQTSRYLSAREGREWGIALDRALGILQGLRTTGRLGR